MIIGIDEVGRGPWAGPLVVGAVILDGVEIDGLNDSKKLTKKRREALNMIIRDQAMAWALGWVSAHELDEVGMSQALRLATRRAVKQIQAQCREKSLAVDQIIIDGTVNFLANTALEKYVTVMAKADGLVPSVSAASIIAKVARDAYMSEQDQVYPGYGFASHAGYGTAKHREAIADLGVCPEHRLSFAPLKKYAERDDSTTEPSLKDGPKSTRQIGDQGEQAVADWLALEGHEIITRNWRTKWCEIDIISSRENILFFTEVKYRKNAQFGDGLAAITAKKQQQIRFAAEVFLAKHPDYATYSVQLLAADVSGEPASVQQVVTIE